MNLERIVDDPQSEPRFTPDQVRTLQEFADNLAMGRRAFRMLAWLCGFAFAMTAFLFYLVNILQNWHGSAGQK